jgi:hypothetical protein
VDLALIPGGGLRRARGTAGPRGGILRQAAGGVDGCPSLVAGAFEVQLVDELPLPRHEVHVDLVLTEKTSYPPGALEMLSGSGNAL